MEEKIHQHLQSIDFLIKSHRNELVTINGGLPSIVIFYFHLHEATQEERHYESAVLYLELLYDALEKSMPERYTYSSGLAGLGWFFSYIQRFIEIENPFDTPEFDSQFMAAAQKELSYYNYEYLIGYCGILQYLISKKSTDHALLYQFIDDVYKQIFSLEDPIIFFKQKDVRHKFPSINLGVSHGMFGFAAILNQLIAKQIHPEKCTTILKFIIDFTFEHEKDFVSEGRFFPDRIGGGIKENRNCRLAWCYGDLGILTVLYNSSIILKDDELQHKVTQMLINTTHRKDLNSTMMNDIWLCHGTCGAAHIFQRLYTTTQIDDCKFAANYWYRKTLEQLDKGSPQIRMNLTRSGSYARKDLTGFLTGYAGLGLSLLSKLPNADMDWDRMILMS
ncbi:lanthionine synthetase LanC family protein [uncultured Kordia sp.]|uniref:lanthionine synthetase LanC family protein n=1 Tax=uncultured Kordia sp. TaxID=507699 RepID=UPI0026199066|nr:lanthionine synthetase LanC family protein [uncultured Kordia sp.]